MIGKLLCLIGKHKIFHLTREEIKAANYEYDSYCLRCNRCFRMPILWYLAKQ